MLWVTITMVTPCRAFLLLDVVALLGVGSATSLEMSDAPCDEPGPIPDRHGVVAWSRRSTTQRRVRRATEY